MIETLKSISMNASGDRIIIGAVQNDTFENLGGKVSVYDWNGSSWIQVGNSFMGTLNLELQKPGLLFL